MGMIYDGLKNGNEDYTELLYLGVVLLLRDHY